MVKVLRSSSALCEKTTRALTVFDDLDVLAISPFEYTKFGSARIDISSTAINTRPIICFETKKWASGGS
jgi:hypothetical protein